MNGFDNNPEGAQDGDDIAVLISIGNDPFTLISRSMKILKNHIRKATTTCDIRHVSSVYQPTNKRSSIKSREIKRTQYPLDDISLYERAPGPTFVDRFGW